MQPCIYPFAEATPDPETGRTVSPEQRLANLMEDVALAAVAMRTKGIRRTSAVPVLSSDDPVRVLQEFSTEDLLSHDRAEIMAGRGSCIESLELGLAK